MNDLIWRQDAIDALGERPLAWTQDEYLRGLQNQYDCDVEAIQNVLPAQQWIPCSESLPEEYKKVLVTDVFNVYIGEFVDAEEKWGGKHFINENGMHSKSVIAWMPLPEPPERIGG